MKNALNLEYLISQFYEHKTERGGAQLRGVHNSRQYSILKIGWVFLNKVHSQI